MAIRNPGNTVTLAIRTMRALEPVVLKAAGVGLARGLDVAVGRSQMGYLQGPRPEKLGERSGRLWNSITRSVTVLSDSVKGQIGTNVRYGAFHEFGFQGTVSVKAHTRVTSTTDEDGNEFDDRREYRDREGNFIGFKDTRKKAAGRQRKGFVQVGFQFVKAHTRQLDYAGRPFIAPAIADSEQTILDEVRRELNALGGANG